MILSLSKRKRSTQVKIAAHWASTALSETDGKELDLQPRLERRATCILMAVRQNPFLRVMNECHVRREGEWEVGGGRLNLAPEMLPTGCSGTDHQEALTPPLRHLWLRGVCGCVRTFVFVTYWGPYSV